jgi:hypothetical protein
MYYYYYYSYILGNRRETFWSKQASKQKKEDMGQKMRKFHINMTSKKNMVINARKCRAGLESDASIMEETSDMCVNTTEKIRNLEIFKFSTISVYSIKNNRFKNKRQKHKVRKLASNKDNMSRQIHRLSKVSAPAKVNGADEEPGQIQFNYPIEAATMHRDG